MKVIKLVILLIIIVSMSGYATASGLCGEPIFVDLENRQPLSSNTYFSENSANKNSPLNLQNVMRISFKNLNSRAESKARTECQSRSTDLYFCDLESPLTKKTFDIPYSMDITWINGSTTSKPGVIKVDLFERATASVMSASTRIVFNSAIGYYDVPAQHLKYSATYDCFAQI